MPVTVTYRAAEGAWQVEPVVSVSTPGDVASGNNLVSAKVETFGSTDMELRVGATVSGQRSATLSFPDIELVNGAGKAIAPRVEVTLPAQVTVVEVSAKDAVCSGTTTLRCDFSNFDALASAHINLSVRASSEYGLHVVAPAIQDDPHNRTRFAIVTDPLRHPAPKASGHDCTSLIVSVTNRPGAVHDMLVPLKKHGVSMSRFESRPARSGQWEYYFYIDLQGHPDDPHVNTALKELRDACAFFKVLGTYPLDVH